MSEPLSDREARICAAATLWLGTPYRHQGRKRGIGCDCLGLVIGLVAELSGTIPKDPGPYGRDITDRSEAGRLAEAARRHCGDRISPAAARPGDLLLFRWRPDWPPRHCGILMPENRFIHAWERAGVVSSPLHPGWAGRIVAIHRFPEV